MSIYSIDASACEVPAAVAAAAAATTTGTKTTGVVSLTYMNHPLVPHRCPGYPCPAMGKTLCLA